MSEGILQAVEQYYASRILTHGATPHGVDWNGSQSQELRFEQLLKLVPPKEHEEGFSVLDVGCGYGALLEWLRARGLQADYYGYDICASMIDAAQKRHHDVPFSQFEVASSPSRKADYAVASGIFNVCQDQPRERWEIYIRQVLDVMHEHSRKGFAFNCLTLYSDEPFMREHLYYADPCFYFDLCKRTYSSQVALLHDYGLYEFTLLVRKTT